jgi:hypothetical protein
MARGWESKSVEAQQEEAVARKPDSGTQPPSPEELQLRQQRESLRLARARVLQQMQASSDARYTEMLQKSLADLDRRIGGS